MKITVKNLQQQTFVVELEENKSVLNLKEEIQKLKGSEYDVQRQKLIYAGVILDDEKSIASYNMDEKKFVVVMVKRDVGGSASAKVEKSATPEAAAKSSPAKTAETSKSVEKAPTAEAEKSEEKPETVATATDTSVATPTPEPPAVAPAGETASASLQSVAESHLLVGQEYAKTVQSIVEMGYSKDMVERAMVASFNNPERAVEYLISGIPDTEVGLLPDVASESLTPRNEGENVTRSTAQRSSDTTGVSAQGPFEFLRTQPQFLQMRTLIHSNPDLLHAVLQQIGQTNPALLQLIYENQEAFLNMLNQPLDGSPASTPITPAMLSGLNLGRNTSEATREESRDNSNNANRPTEEGGNTGQRGIQIRLTPQDQEAIERLKALGFPEVLVLQAYFACEKNEQLAANFLLSSSFDD